MSRSTTRTRSNLKLDSELSGPESKRRRVGVNNCLSAGNGTSSRTGNGPRTRGMAGDDASSANSSGAPGPAEKLGNGSGNEKKLTRNEAENESSSGDTTSDSSDSSDSEDSSDMDSDENDRLKSDSLTLFADVERQFSYVRELIYREKILQAEAILNMIRQGKGTEYLTPLQSLNKNMATRIETASNLRDFQLQSLQHKIEGEALAAIQNLESDKALLIDEIKSDLEGRIQRLEEDRHNDFTSEFWLESMVKPKNKKSVDIFGEKKKKAVTVSGPYIVYMLNDVDIVEDWTVMKKAISAPRRGIIVM